LSIGIVSPVIQLAPALTLIQDPNGAEDPDSGGLFIATGTLADGFGTGRELPMIGAFASGSNGDAPNAGGLRIGVGEPGGEPAGEGVGPSPFIDIAIPSDDTTVNGSIVIGGVTSILVGGYALPTGAALLGAGDLLIGTAAPALTITEAATPTVTAATTSVVVNTGTLPIGDLLLLVISMLAPAGGVAIPAQVASVQGFSNGKHATNGQPAAGSAINGTIAPTNPGNVQGNVSVDVWTIPVSSGSNVTVNFTRKCASVIRAYAITGVRSIGVYGYDQPEEAAAFGGDLSAGPTDGFLAGYFPSTTPYSLQNAVLSVIAYDSATTTIGTLNGAFTNDAAVQANGMTEQSGHAIVTRAGAGPGDYVGTLSHAQNWVAMSVVFTGKAGGAIRLAPSNGVLQAQNGVLSWAAVPAADVTFPLVATTDQAFRPNSIGNSALVLHNNASASTRLEITATNGAGLILSSEGPAGAVPIYITPQTGGLTIVSNFADLGGEKFNVKAYGATGGGSIDDTTAIQNTINAAKAASGAVFFPQGNYLVTKSLNCTGFGVLTPRFYGAGVGATKILADLTEAYPVFDFTGSGHLHFDSIWITGNVSGLQTCAALFARQAVTLVGDVAHIDHIEVDGTYSLVGLAFVDCDLATVKNSDISGPSGAVVEETDILGVGSKYATFSPSAITITTFDNCSFYISGRSGIIFGHGVTLAGNNTYINLSGTAAQAIEVVEANSAGGEVRFGNLRVESNGSSVDTSVLSIAAGQDSGAGELSGQWSLNNGGGGSNTAIVKFGNGSSQILNYTIKSAYTDGATNFFAGGGVFANCQIWNGYPDLAIGSVGSGYNNFITHATLGAPWTIPGGTSSVQLIQAGLTAVSPAFTNATLTGYNSSATYFYIFDSLRMFNAQAITDGSNGNPVLTWGMVASAVNSVQITNATTGVGATIAAFGETNAPLNINAKGSGGLKTSSVFFPVQAITASAPAYVKGGMYFDTTLNKLRIGGATAWETVTSV
jgi:hypothetical protein